MRIGAAEPEHEGLARAALREELVELLELRPGRIARAPARLELTRSPALAHEADVIASPLEQIGIHGEPLGKKSVEIAPFGKTMNRLTGEEGGTRRCARGGRGERVQEECAFAGNPVERRRRDGAIAVPSGVGERPVVGDGEKDVGPRLCRLSGAVRRGPSRQTQDSRDDDEECQDARHQTPLGGEDETGEPVDRTFAS